ncbi:hypothetical protein [Kitasatospora sp. NPDC088346]
MAQQDLADLGGGPQVGAVVELVILPPVIIFCRVRIIACLFATGW